MGQRCISKQRLIFIALVAWNSALSTVATAQTTPKANPSQGKYSTELACHAKFVARNASAFLGVTFSDGVQIGFFRGKVAVPGVGMRPGVYIVTPNACYSKFIKLGSKLLFKVAADKYIQVESSPIDGELETTAFERLNGANASIKPIDLSIETAIREPLPTTLLRQNLLPALKQLYLLYTSEKLLSAESPLPRFLDVLGTCAKAADPAIKQAAIDELTLRFKIAIVNESKKEAPVPEPKPGESRKAIE